MKRAIPGIAFLLLLSISLRGQVGPIGDKILPIRYDGHWHIAAMVDGSASGCFVFDTGASNLLADSLWGAGSTLSKKPWGMVMIGGVGGTPQRARAFPAALEFRVGDLGETFSMTPLIQLKPLLGRYADGIVGWHFFKGRIVEFDCERMALRLLSARELSELSGYERIPLSLRNDRFYIKIAIGLPSGKTIDGEWLLDLGSGNGLSITSPTAKRHNLALEGPTVTFHSSWNGLGGKSSGALLRVESIRIGSFVLPSPIVEYSEDKAGALSKDSHLGLLGNGVLSRFTFVIDFRTEAPALWLRPNGNYDTPWELSRAGFRAVDRTDICDGLIINSLHRNRNAERAGLQLDDTITHIDNLPVQGMGIGKAATLLKTARDSVSLTILRAGETLTIGLPLPDPDF